jgi:hypothetical protein
MGGSQMLAFVPTLRTRSAASPNLRRMCAMLPLSGRCRRCPAAVPRQSVADTRPMCAPLR